METRLILYLIGVLALVAGSFTAMADQSAKFVGTHEIPPFVLERVELTPGVTAARKRPAEAAPRPATPRAAG
ncbi:MAG: hypothetical protein ACRD5D_09385 [Candidatus Polarisedimenticolia bacterium]